MSFSTSAFWLSLYLQNVLKFSALKVAIHLLPQAIAGILVNIIAGFVLHRVDNKLLTGIGALSYLASVLLLALMKEASSYWAFIFPSLLLSVIGADLQFNVANVSSTRPPVQPHLPEADVCDVLPPTQSAIPGGRHLQHRNQTLFCNWPRHISQYLQCRINW